MNQHAQNLFDARRSEFDGMDYPSLALAREQLIDGLMSDNLGADERAAALQLLVEASGLLLDSHDESDPLADAKTALTENPHSQYQQDMVSNLERAIDGDFEEPGPVEGVHYIAVPDEEQPTIVNELD